MDACMSRHKSFYTHTRTHTNQPSVVVDTMFSFPNHSNFYNNLLMQVISIFFFKKKHFTHTYAHTQTLFPCHYPWMPKRDALKGAWRTGYHFQEEPTGPCSPCPKGRACVCARVLS